MTWTGKGTFRNADGDWVNCPYVNFNDGNLKFNANLASKANSNYGAAAGFPGLL